MSEPEQPKRPPNPMERQALAAEASAAAMERIADDVRAMRREHEEPRGPEPDHVRFVRPDNVLTLAPTSPLRRRARFMAFLRPFFDPRDWRVVPDSHWERDFETEEGEEVELAAVRCPCGSELIVETWAECPGKLHSGEPCKRCYLFLGTLYVVGGPLDRLAPWERIALQHAKRQTPA